MLIRRIFDLYLWVFLYNIVFLLMVGGVGGVGVVGGIEILVLVN